MEAVAGKNGGRIVDELWKDFVCPRGWDEHVVFFGAMLTRAMLFCAMRIFEEGRWSQISNYDVSRESNRQPLAYETRMVPQDHCQCTQLPPPTRARTILLQFFHNSSTISPRLEEFSKSQLAWGRIVEGIVLE
jgi:hypothetical protein